MTAYDVIKTGDVTKNFNEMLRIYFIIQSLKSDTCRHSFAFILDSFDISLL